MTKLKRKGKVLSKKVSTLDSFYGFHSIVRANNDCVEVLNGMVGFSSGFMTLLFTGFIIYGYCIISMHPSFESITDYVFFFTVFFIGFLTFLLVPLVIYFTIRQTPAPIRFNRKIREIYMMQHEVPKQNKKRELLRFDWNKVDFRRELMVIPSGGGPPRMEHCTFFFGKDLNDDKGTEHKVQIASGSGSEEDQDIVWEYIRRFMENEEIALKTYDPEDDTKEIFRSVKQGESFNHIDHMPEYLPFWEQFKTKLRFNFIDPYKGTVIPRLKGSHPKLNMESSIGNFFQFIYFQVKFLVLLVYPFFAILGIPAMLISSWAYGRKPINEFPEENNELCGLGSMESYIKELIKNGGEPEMKD